MTRTEIKKIINLFGEALQKSFESDRLMAEEEIVTFIKDEMDKEPKNP